LRICRLSEARRSCHLENTQLTYPQDHGRIRSKGEGHGDSNLYPRQRREIQKWLKGNRITGARWYVDHETGDNLDRPDFERLQKDVFMRDVQTVVVWKLDRFSRTIRDGLTTLCGWCDRGLRVVSVTQQIDFNGSIGKMIAAVLFGVAEMEQQNLRERQAAGIAAAKERGVYIGRVPGTTRGGSTRICFPVYQWDLSDHIRATETLIGRRERGMARAFPKSKRGS